MKVYYWTDLTTAESEGICSTLAKAKVRVQRAIQEKSTQPINWEEYTWTFEAPQHILSLDQNMEAYVKEFEVE